VKKGTRIVGRMMGKQVQEGSKDLERHDDCLNLEVA